MKIKDIIAALAITMSVVVPASAQNLNSIAQVTCCERGELAKLSDDEVMENEKQPVSEEGQLPYDQIMAVLDSLTPFYNSQQQQSATALRVLEKCVAQQGSLASGACQAEKADFDAKRLPAITLRDEIARLEAMLPQNER